ncbi:MAG: prefoldin subunit [Nanoarchaeota archaeon]
MPEQKDSSQIQELQMLEQNLQSIMYQKQAFQSELAETQSALKEVNSSKEDVYKLAGQILIKTSVEKIKQELQNKEKILNMRLEKLEKQESELNKRVEDIRNNAFKNLQDNKK